MFKQSDVRESFVTPFGGIRNGRLVETSRSRVAFVIVLIGLIYIRSR